MTEREREDYEQLADELDKQAGQLDEQQAELGAEIKDTRQDWERKRADPNVPGAPPPEGETDSEDDDSSEDDAG